MTRPLPSVAKLPLAPPVVYGSASDKTHNHALTSLVMSSASLFGIPEACLVHALIFLGPADLYRFSLVSSDALAGALDEAVWRALTLRAYGKDVKEPADFCWRAEYKTRAEGAARAQAYMKALTMGRAGKIQSPPPRLRSSLCRYAALEGPLMQQSRDAERAAVLACPADPLQAHLASLDAARAAPKSDTIRQGTASWSSLEGGGERSDISRTNAAHAHLAF